MSRILHTGGAPGADKAWTDLAEHSNITVNVWSKNDLKSQHPTILQQIDISLSKAALVLGRPSEFSGKNYVRRDWLQVNMGSQQVVAVSYIIAPGHKDHKGYVNKTAYPIVSGGTGWTVQFGIMAGHEVKVFDMLTNKWYVWNYNFHTFRESEVPELYKQFTGVGSRELTREGEQAIKDVYTLNYPK